METQKFENTIEYLEKLYEQKSELIDWKKTIRYINLYANGNVCKKKVKHKCSNLLFEIIIPSYYYKITRPRLLFCYDNGKVNIMNPKKILDVKLKIPGTKSNGYKNDGSCELREVYVCNMEDLLIIRSRQNGKDMVKAIPLKYRQPHGAMDAAGNVMIKDAIPCYWQVVPGELTNDFRCLITGGTSPGVSTELPIVREKLRLLHHLRERKSHILHFSRV